MNSVDSIAAVLRFTLEQLEANRAGRITRDQLMALAPDLVMPFLLIVAVTGLAIFSRRFVGEWTPSRVLLIVAVVMGGVGFSAWIGLAPLRDLLVDAPAVVQGELVEVRSEPRSKGTAPLVVIDSVELHAQGEPNEARKLVLPGTYRAYYLPHTKRLLSLEPVQ
jgi:hypothetical protein